MATIKTNVPATWANTSDTNVSIWDRFIAFADSQHERKTMWYFLALVVQGIFFLPLPAFLMYYYNAPIIVLLITLTCFFTSIIACMGGAGIRSVLLLSAASVLIQVLMTIAVLI
ncbi:hypothetical protein [Mucilaginibacter sp. BT774]|uniref:hypothetical protein n=1 Tax=Mucilaginibacter sp. BT774 TaxID=3062276 RepID=UPI002675076F|nr:hypothetical protein [Mucilaginibacter sp. BT774]MDO3627293.1 hypothetical protein [Mucilaginibacter sp. BT774]